MAKSIIQRLIDAEVFTHDDVEQYLENYNNKQGRLIKRQVEEKTQHQDDHIETYSKIENGVLVKFDERDLDESGNYIVPDNVRRIKRYAFSSCKKIMAVKLGPNVKIIDTEAFFNCGLRYIDLANVEIIREWAFSFCLDLEEIKLSKQLKSVGCAVFYNCMKLKNFITPKGDIITIAGSEFANRSDAHSEIQSYIQKNKGLAK